MTAFGPVAMTLLLAATALLAACAAPDDAPARRAPTGAAQYLTVETRLLDGDLVSFLARTRGPGARDAALAYARCAAAQYALIRGYGFARHVRTNVARRGGIWQADGVYTISAALPRGRRTIDAEVVVDDCDVQGIPTV